MINNVDQLRIDCMLVSMGNMEFSNNTLINDGLRKLGDCLPTGWKIGGFTPASATDAIAEIRAPDQRTAALGLEAKARLTPKLATDVIRRFEEGQVRAPVVVSEFVSDRTRELLRENNIGFIDLTGNIRLVLSEPGLFIETTGAGQNPKPEKREASSLKAVKAGRLARALIEQRAVMGVRELATKTELDAGYVSRLFSFLDDEALITRVGRGRLESVDWTKLLERWGADAPLSARGRVTTFVAPRGLTGVLELLRKTSQPYAITGSFAANRIAPIAPARLLTLYARDVAALVNELGLRPADAGANVQFVEPADEEVFRGVRTDDGLRYAALPIVAIDLLDGPGRAPSEGEELIAWMAKNEDAWRG